MIERDAVVPEVELYSAIEMEVERSQNHGLVELRTGPLLRENLQKVGI